MEEQPESEELIYPTFTAQSPYLRVLDSRWEAGDRIGIFSPRESDLPYVTAHGDGRFAPDGPDRITMDPEGDTFTAYYPYQSGDKDRLTVDLRTQQPLLFGRGRGIKGEDEVELSFTHRLAQIRVVLDPQIEGLDLSDAQVELQGYPSEAVMDKRTGAVRGGTAHETLPTTRVGNTFIAYLLPDQPIGSEEHQILISVGNHLVTLREPAIDGVTSYESGRYYRITLHLKSKDDSSDPTPSKSGMTASIRAFEEGGSVDGDILLPGSGGVAKGGILLEEHFDRDLGQMTSHAVLGRGFDFEVEEGVAQISGHRMGITEYYLISPLLDLTGVSEGTLSFVHSITEGKRTSEEQTLLMTTDRVDPRYPEGALWEQVEIPAYPAEGSEDFVACSIALPKHFLGEKNVRFAFRYKSSRRSEALWRIDDLILRTVGGGRIQTQREERPVEPTVGGLLFPGADCESESAFRAALGKQRMRTYAVLSRDHESPERGGVLSVVKSMPGNDYLLSFRGAVPSGARRISFLLKGQSSARSMSVNLYTTERDAKGQPDYICYNLGDVRASDLSLSPETHNGYKGTIHTGGRWIKVTLELPKSGLNTDPKGELLAIKLGGKSEVRLMLDHFTVE